MEVDLTAIHPPGSATLRWYTPSLGHANVEGVSFGSQWTNMSLKA